MKTENTDVTPVTMKLSSKTIERVERIKDQTQEKNRTRIMATGVEILDLLINEVQHGGKIFIEKTDGSKEKINIVGL